MQKRVHRERKNEQFVERKKDYKLRAADYHSKQETLKKLVEKTKNRNKDEFYNAMQVKLHNKDVGPLKKQDHNHVRLLTLINNKKLQNVPLEIDCGTNINTEQRIKHLSEYSNRLERKKQLRKMDKELQVTLHLMGKVLQLMQGPRQKIGTDKDGVGIYKWKQVRKK
jgi:hypothetical protein